MQQTSVIRNKTAPGLSDRYSRRLGLRNLVVTGLILLSCHALSAHARTTNPVVRENAKPGTSDWAITLSADDTNQQIKGFASATSVNRGRRINFLISTNRAQGYRIEIYRMGWYGGAGGRLMRRIGPLAGAPQASPAYDAATGMVSYRWKRSYRLEVPKHWTSGIYLAKLINDDGYENYINFVVRDDSRRADFLYQQPVTTYQAYNSYPRTDVGTPAAVEPGNLATFSGSAFAAPALGTSTDAGTISEARPALQGPSVSTVAPVTTTALSADIAPDIGKSLYDFNSSAAVTTAGTTRALKVSFDRPYEGWGDGQFFAWEIFQVQWLERNGYDVAYATNIDVHRRGAKLLKRYKGFLSVGHDEYWTDRMVDSVEAARDSGVDLAFFGSNAAYWQVRLERNAAGRRNRTLVCYKNRALDPEARPAFETIRWRDLGRPEQALIGVQYVANNEWAFNTDFVVTDSDNWVYANTGFQTGDTVAGIVGYEVDLFDPNEPAPTGTDRALLSASPYTGRDGTEVVSNASIYRAPSGAWVFATGTMSWSWALGRDGFIDDRIGTTTENVLRRFLTDD